MDKESRQTALAERRQKYFSLDSDLENFKWKLKELKKHRGHTNAFKSLFIAVEMMQQQIKLDFDRYEKRLNRQTQHEDIERLMQSLNRERAKREALEKQIKEASESSGLFIRYVREKLGL